jgi:hypothetical protein
MSNTGSTGPLAPIHMNQMDLQCSPQGCRRIPGFYRPTRRVITWRLPDPQAERTTNVVVGT